MADYLHITDGEAAALDIIEDIDHRISAVPPFPGLRQFPDGRDYNQWTGDDSKVLMKVFLSAIAGYLPSTMVQSIATFMDVCYIARHNAITAPALEHFHESIENFHELRNIFIEAGVRDSISLPCQHALKHFYRSIHLFSSPNGLCSSITESKHIKAVKEPWRRSSRYQALIQMLRTLVQMDQMAALRRVFLDCGMLAGTTSSYMAGIKIPKDQEENLCFTDAVDDDDDKDEDDGGPIQDDPTPALFDVKLAAKFQYHYPRDLKTLAGFISQPKFPLAF